MKGYTLRREATRKDLPLMNTNQAQCMLCYRIFTADGICEQHKPYARAPEDEGKRGRVALRGSCTEPDELGMVGIPRADGVVVWGFRTEDAHQERIDRMANARAARKPKGSK